MPATPVPTRSAMRAQVTPFSSVVGQSLTVESDDGIVALLSISIPDPNHPYRETARQFAQAIALAINEPASDELKSLRVRLAQVMIEQARLLAAAEEA